MKPIVEKTKNKENEKTTESIKVKPQEQPQPQPEESPNEDINKTLVLLKILGIIMCIIFGLLFLGTLLYSVVEAVDNSTVLILLKSVGDGFFETLLFNLNQFNVQKEYNFFLAIKNYIPKWIIVWILPLFIPIMMSLAIVVNWIGILYFWSTGIIHCLKSGDILHSALYAFLYLFLLFFPIPFFTIAGCALPIYGMYNIVIKNSQMNLSQTFYKILCDYSAAISIILINVTSILCFVQYGYGVGLLSLFLSIVACIALIRNQMY
jgi:hypothetical protein